MPPVVSIVIPTFEHGACVADAIESALAQTVPCQVIVIDDGSTDDTRQVLRRFIDRPGFRYTSRGHLGPSKTRNLGLDLALDVVQSDFVMFLDADDVIAPEKVEKQLAAFTDEVGWVLCDVEIRRPDGRTVTASQQYDYRGLGLKGWIEPQLRVKNFIPIMSPLVKGEVLRHIRFTDDRLPEDWHFWHAVAGVARVAYVPEVLATYRKRATGRNAQRPRPAISHPATEPPLRLNLGCGQRGTACWHPLPGMANLDKSLGWSFEDGLGDFVSGSVAGITISHALMHLPLSAWPALFAECARVLEPGGVLRITEDDAINPQSQRYGGWKGSQPALTLTDAAVVRRHLEAAGLRPVAVDVHTTQYRDVSLMQAFHGAAPDVFFIEGIRDAAVLFAPHNDDEALFAAFSIIRHRPAVVVCFPSVPHYGDPKARETESRVAVDMLGGGPVDQWQGGDLVAQMRALDAQQSPAIVFAPARQASHPEHVAVHDAAREVFGPRLRCYHTYDARGKVRAGDPVPFEREWIARKRHALACYRTQLEHPRAKVFFEDDLCEYAE
jgi:SAM-dependent methyltransferase